MTGDKLKRACNSQTTTAHDDTWAIYSLRYGVLPWKFKPRRGACQTLKQGPVIPPFSLAVAVIQPLYETKRVACSSDKLEPGSRTRPMELRP